MSGALPLHVGIQRAEEDATDAILFSIYADYSSAKFVSDMIMFMMRNPFFSLRRRRGAKYLGFYDYEPGQTSSHGVGIIKFAISAGMVNSCRTTSTITPRGNNCKSLKTSTRQTPYRSPLTDNHLPVPSNPT